MCSIKGIKSLTDLLFLFLLKQLNRLQA